MLFYVGIFLACLAFECIFVLVGSCVVNWIIERSLGPLPVERKAVMAKKKKGKAEPDDEEGAAGAVELERLRSENAELLRRVETVEGGKCPSCDAELKGGVASFDAAKADAAQCVRLRAENAELVRRLAEKPVAPAGDDVGVMGRFYRGE